MLNEEKIRLMTQAATCYKRQEKKAMRINEYYKKDYVSYNVIKTFIVVSFSYVLVAAAFALCSIEWVLENGGRMQIIIFAILFLLMYIFTAIFSIIYSRRVYSDKFQDARKDVKEYQQMLLRIEAFYGKEKKSASETRKEDVI